MENCTIIFYFKTGYSQNFEVITTSRAEFYIYIDFSDHRVVLNYHVFVFFYLNVAKIPL